MLADGRDAIYIFNNSFPPLYGNPFCDNIIQPGVVTVLLVAEPLSWNHSYSRKRLTAKHGAVIFSVDKQGVICFKVLVLEPQLLLTSNTILFPWKPT